LPTWFVQAAASEARGVATAAELGCNGPNPLQCLRALPTSAILAKERGAQTDTAAAQPAWGGGAFPLPMREAIDSGRFARVPLMQGSNGDEAMFSLAARHDGRGNPLTADQYPAILKQYLGASRVAAVEAHYPLANYPAPIYALSAVLTDSGMITNNRIGLSNLHLANQLASPHVPLYSYVFADRTAPYPAPIFTAPGNLPGAAHTKELSYLFHQSELTTAQRRISDTMIGYWTNFAAKGDLNGPGLLPAWPTYTPEGQMVMKFAMPAAWVRTPTCIHRPNAGSGLNRDSAISLAPTPPPHARAVHGPGDVGGIAASRGPAALARIAPSGHRLHGLRRYIEPSPRRPHRG
jgi:para-nitrobenzyl esterase